MEIDFLTIFNDPKLRFNISHILSIEIRESLNKLFHNFQFKYDKLIFSIGASSNINNLKKIDEFLIENKKNKSIAYVIPHNGIIKTKHHEVDGDFKSNLRLTQKSENSYSTPEYIECVKKILIYELNLNSNEIILKELEALTNDWLKKFTSNKYRWINQVEMLIEEMNDIKNKPESARTDYENEEFDFYFDTYVKFTNDVEFDKEGYILPPSS